MSKWNYVNKNGNPKEAGKYLCILLWNVYEDGEPTEKVEAFVDCRYFVDLEAMPDEVDWIMDDQPEEGLAWISQTGSMSGERVWAWMPIEEIDTAELPEGTEVDRWPNA